MSKKSFKALVHDLVEAAEEKGKLEFICEAGLDEDDPKKYRRDLREAKKELKAAKAETLSYFPRSRNFAIAMNDEGYQDTPMVIYWVTRFGETDNYSPDKADAALFPDKSSATVLMKALGLEGDHSVVEV